MAKNDKYESTSEVLIFLGVCLVLYIAFLIIL